jgi:hypothetical protein
MPISVGTESVCPQFYVCHDCTHSRFEAVYSRFLFLLDQTVAARCSLGYLQLRFCSRLGHPF